MGAPLTVYTEELALEILQRISQGSSVPTICAQLQTSYGTVTNWILRNTSGFGERYAAAREQSADFLAEEIVELADDENIEADSRRIRVDARKWVAAKLKPRKYGDKTILSNDPDNPISALAVRLDTAITQRNVIDVTPGPAKITYISNDASDLI